MEQPTTGRRRRRTGGVTVAELVERQQPEPAGMMPSTTDELGAVTVGDTAAAGGFEAVPAAPERGTSNMAKAGRIAGLTIGVLALCGAVTAAWTIDGRDKHQTPAAAPHLEITGVDALRPDTLAARLGDRSTGSAGEEWTRRGTATQESSTSGGHSGYGSPHRDGRQDRLVSGAGMAPDDVINSDTSPTGVVRQFFRLISADPKGAVRLLDPKLAGSHVPSLVRSWQRTRRVVVEDVTDNGDGTVTAVVRLLRLDGSWLRMRQLLSTTPDKPPRIGSVRVLSVQLG